MTPIRHPRRSGRTARWLASGAAVAIALSVTVVGALAHGPDPALSGGPFGQNQDLRFRWRSGSEPPTAIKTAIRSAAAASNAGRASKAATFTYDASGSSPVGYGIGATCGVNGLACFTRSVPTGFTLWLREQGHVFDWGTMKWCQMYTTPPNGCYDAQMIALDELGHVEGLGHHVNLGDDSDYVDAIVQTYARAKPVTGWNMHAYGRCDVATLQILYDMPSWTARYSTCLDLATSLTLVADPAAVPAYGTTTLTATLKVVDSDAYGRLGGDPIAGRVVTLQRRTSGSTTWVSMGAMAAGPTAGTYVLAQQLSSDTEFRAVFHASTAEGLRGSTSPTVAVSVYRCIPGPSQNGSSAIPCI